VRSDWTATGPNYGNVPDSAAPPPSGMAEASAARTHADRNSRRAPV